MYELNYSLHLFLAVNRLRVRGTIGSAHKLVIIYIDMNSKCYQFVDRSYGRNLNFVKRRKKGSPNLIAIDDSNSILSRK